MIFTGTPVVAVSVETLTLGRRKKERRRKAGKRGRPPVAGCLRAMAASLRTMRFSPRDGWAVRLMEKTLRVCGVSGALLLIVYFWCLRLPTTLIVRIEG